MDDMKVFMDQAQAGGFVEYRPGCYLATAEYMQAEQKRWGEDDKAKSIDFTVAPYWITTDSGDSPVPVDGV